MAEEKEKKKNKKYPFPVTKLGSKAINKTRELSEKHSKFAKRNREYIAKKVLEKSRRGNLSRQGERDD